jgi:hypothetical protein
MSLSKTSCTCRNYAGVVMARDVQALALQDSSCQDLALLVGRMATVEVLTLAPEAPGPDSLPSPLTEIPADEIDTTPTTPTRSSARDASTPLTLRRSDRTKNPSERMREIDNGTDNDTGVHSRNTDHGQKTKGKRGRPPKEQQVEVQTEPATIPLVQVLQLIHSMSTKYETKMEQHMKVYENKIEEHMKAYENKIKEHMEA